MPKPQPMPKTLLAKFHASTAPLLARMTTFNNSIKLAQASEKPTHNN